MMGPQVAKRERITAFRLDDYVPATHLLRSIDRFLGFSGLRHRLAIFYSHTGRPSIDPELMLRMLVIGYCCGIRSERRLCEEVPLNLAYRWFCRLGLKDPVPDHSSFSKNRLGRFLESDTFRQLFELVRSQCIAQGLVAGEGFAVERGTRWPGLLCLLYQLFFWICRPALSWMSKRHRHFVPTKLSQPA